MLGQSLQREMEHARYFQYNFTTSVTVFVHNSELLKLLTFCLFSTQHRSSGLNRKLRPLIFKSIIERIFLTHELAGLLHGHLCKYTCGCHPTFGYNRHYVQI
jgi:hypothetical protein